mmetsp:Transcript_101258/g.285450  ORF Transcript_101258/g.285450 Transcript_101258/m.285450 type:complete len:216 (-) Transcript_101258:350-997(-)
MRKSHWSTSAFSIRLRPSEQHRSNTDFSAAAISAVKEPSSWSILESMFVARMVAGVPLRNATSAASSKWPMPCFLVLLVSCNPSRPRSVGSPDSRKSGPTSPATRSSRTPLIPWLLRSPQKITGTLVASSPWRFASFDTASRASCVCRTRRSACGPADRCAFTTKSDSVELASAFLCNKTVSVRSLWRAAPSSQSVDRQNVAGRMRPFFSCRSAE